MLTFSSSMDIPYIFFDCWICQTMLTLLREVYHNSFWHFLIILNRLICLIKYTVVGGWILLCFMTPALMLAQCSLCSGYRQHRVVGIKRLFFLSYMQQSSHRTSEKLLFPFKDAVFSAQTCYLKKCNTMTAEVIAEKARLYDLTWKCKLFASCYSACRVI